MGCKGNKLINNSKILNQNHVFTAFFTTHAVRVQQNTTCWHRINYNIKAGPLILNGSNSLQPD